MQPPDSSASTDDMRVLIARSLDWLVSAVVAGSVRDVVLAAPPDLELGDIADQVGCELVEGGPERFRGAVAACRCDAILVLVGGYQPQGSLLQELESWSRSRAGTVMRLVAVPETLLQRLWPNARTTVGILAGKDRCLRTSSFRDLVRASKGSTRFKTPAQKIV